MSAIHVQRQCDECGRSAIWTPKAVGRRAAATEQETTCAERLDVLGVARGTGRAVEVGDLSGLDVIGDAWNVEERARAKLDRLGMAHIGFDRTVGAFSGGESVMLTLSGLLLRARRAATRRA